MVRVVHLGGSCTVPFCIAERNAQPPRHMATRGSDMLVPFSVTQEERAAWIRDTLNPESRPPVESSSHPRIPPPRPLPPPGRPTHTYTD